ncbi:MAG TPA: hypothetical protein VEG84_06390, partial [Thermoanaerobaculia bacterium]|nr:hypothetical protein [Thermoanaerobaculia bacterium]
MKLSRCLVAPLTVALFCLASASPAQTGCAPTTGTAAAGLPNFSGTIVPNVFAIPPGGQYLYMKTQYGVVRGSLANPAAAGPFKLAQIGDKTMGGVDNGGKVPLNCDCYQPSLTMDAAEAPDGTARMITDWNNLGGGLGAEVAVADSANNMYFGQQIDDGTRVQGSRVAALYLASGKYVGYIPFASSSGGGVAVVDVSSPTGDASIGGAIDPFSTLAWGNGAAVVLKSAHVGSLYLLAGAVSLENKIRIAEVDPNTGIPNPTAIIATTGGVSALSIAQVNSRTFIFSAEGTSGIQVYEYASGALSHTGAITGGNYNEVVVTGGLFPLIFAHNTVTLSVESYIDAFDTNWVTQGGAPRQAAHLRHYGAPEHFTFPGFQAMVVGNSAYVYRLETTPSNAIETTSLDISCISISPTSPPIVNSVATNLSAQQRSGTERNKNYLGDQLELKDASASAPVNPLLEISWDFNYTGTFVPDPAWNGVTYNVANSD